MGPAAQAENLSVVLDRTVLLAPTSFSLGPGRALAVTGTNGSGKTTLLRAVAGRVPPTTGRALVGGQPPDDRDPAFRARLAALLTLPPLARGLTLREHILMVAVSWGLSVTEAADRADGLLAELEIRPLASRYPHELSAGQTQLFALALTLARPFDVLLLDEPEQRLDPDRLELVAQVLQARLDKGSAILLASHSEPLVDRLADDDVVLREGVPEREL